MSGPPCGELNAYLAEKYAAIRAAEAKAKAAAEMDAPTGMCAAVPSDAELTKALRASGDVVAVIAEPFCCEGMPYIDCCKRCLDEYIRRNFPNSRG